MIATMNLRCGYLCTLETDEGFVVDPDCPAHAVGKTPFRPVRYPPPDGPWWCVGYLEIPIESPESEQKVRVPFCWGLS